MKIRTPLVHSSRSYVGNLALLLLALTDRSPHCSDSFRLLRYFCRAQEARRTRTVDPKGRIGPCLSTATARSGALQYHANVTAQPLNTSTAPLIAVIDNRQARMTRGLTN
jgi:hypothetical protein